jgi:hypothetical protein
MAEKAILDVLGLERFAEQRVGAKIDHARREIITGAPVGVNLLQFLRRERVREFSWVSHGIFSGESVSAFTS